MPNGDLTIREVFQQLIESQNKGLAVQRDTAVALATLSESCDDCEARLTIVEEKLDKLKNPLNNRFLLAVLLGGWILAALALGVQGVMKLATLFGF